MTDDDFGQLLAAQWTKLRDRAKHVLGTRGDPDDLASEAIANVWSAYKRGTYIEQGQLNGYCYRVVGYLAFDFLRAEKRLQWSRSLDEPLEGGALLGDRVPSQQDVERDVVGTGELADALSVLREKDRLVLNLRMVGYTQAEIAKSLGITEAAVEARIFRGRARVRAHYSGVSEGPPTSQSQARKLLDSESYTAPTSRCSRGECPPHHNHALPLSRMVA